MLNCTYLIIGSGETGLILAEELSKLKESVILVEQTEFGGGYLNSEDYPKYLLEKESTNFASSLKLFKDYPDTFSVIRKYRKKINPKIESEIKKTKNKKLTELEKNKKFKLVQGKAEFFSKSLVEVNSDKERHLISFKKCLIATGKTEVNLPEINGLDKIPFLHQYNAYLLEDIPSTLAIYGCTTLSLELASIYSGLGIKVVIFEPETPKKAIKGLDRSAFNHLVTTLNSRQVEFFFETSIKSLKKNGKQILIVDSNREEKKVSHFYVEVEDYFDGDSLKLKKVGVKYSKKGVQADKNGKTTLSGVFAFGECTENVKKDNKLAIVYDYIKSEAKKKDKNTNFVIPVFGSYFTENEVSPLGINVRKISSFSPVVNVGFSESEAVSNYGTYIRTEIISSSLYDGFFKIIYKQNNDQVLGIVLTGEFAIKMENYAVLAMKKNIPKKQIRNFMSAYWGI